MADYPTDYYFDLIKNQPNVQEIFSHYNKSITMNLYKYSTLIVNVFYDDLAYNSIIESPALTYDQVMGIIGLVG